MLTVDGKTYRQRLVVTLDPRVHVSPGDLEAQLDLARQIDEWMDVSYRSYNEAGALRAALAATQKGADGNPQMKELSDNLVANSRLVPAGIVAVNRAQERGYAFVSV